MLLERSEEKAPWVAAPDDMWRQKTQPAYLCFIQTLTTYLIYLGNAIVVGHQLQDFNFGVVKKQKWLLLLTVYSSFLALKQMKM